MLLLPGIQVYNLTVADLFKWKICQGIIESLCYSRFIQSGLAREYDSILNPQCFISY
jgi:hypothetical protein